MIRRDRENAWPRVQHIGIPVGRPPILVGYAGARARVRIEPVNSSGTQRRSDITHPAQRRYGTLPRVDPGAKVAGASLA